ncbi:MAG: hypothetical protein A4E65_00783 [Syntrophorhabdus sp. PtaU1.Bin153]|nr:MAG: hypothetical protein A4E65_00783 [Syntrophorhabdus sp. PtaU1.Bin153]
MSRQIICKTCKTPDPLMIQENGKTTITCTGCGLETEGLSFAWIVKQVDNDEQKEEKTAMTEKTNAVPEQTGEEQKKKRGRPAKENVKEQPKDTHMPDAREFPTFEEAIKKIEWGTSVFHADLGNVIVLNFTEHKGLLKALKEHSKEEFRTPEEQALYFIKDALEGLGE